MSHVSKDYLQDFLDGSLKPCGELEGDGFDDLIISADFTDTSGHKGKIHFGAEKQISVEQSDICGDGFGENLATEFTFESGSARETVVVCYTAELKRRQVGLKQAIAASIVAAGLLLGTGHPVEAASFSQDASAVSTDAFTGAYSVPGNWTLTNVSADGAANISGTPNTLVLSGGNLNDNSSGTTLYTIAAAGTGTVSFSWSYSTNDPAPGYDFAGYVVNGTYTTLTGEAVNAPPVGITGTVSFNVTVGEIFGFRVTTVDNSSGAGFLTITNFAAPVTAVPEPTATAGLLLFGAFGAWKFNSKRNRKLPT